MARYDKETGQWLLCFIPDEYRKQLIEKNNLSITLGEFAYQLRAALDGLIWDAVTLSEGAEPVADADGLSRLYFPILSGRDQDFKKCGLHKFKLPDTLKEWIESIQPGMPDKAIGHPDRGLGTTLEHIHNLARFDRHRRLRLFGVGLGAGAVEVETTPPGGVIDWHEWIEWDPFGGKYEYLRFKVVCPGGLIPYKVKLKSRISFQIVAEDVAISDGTYLGIQLGRFMEAVSRVIDVFDAAFPPEL